MKFRSAKVNREHKIHIAMDPSTQPLCGAEWNGHYAARDQIKTFCGPCVIASQDQAKQIIDEWIDLVDRLEDRLGAIQDLTNPRLPHYRETGL